MDNTYSTTETEDNRALVTTTATPLGSAQVMQPTQADWDALKGTVGKGCNDAQFRVFALAAKRLGLDAFARQIVPIVQGGNMTPQVTIDGFRLIAERTGKYAGQVGPFWCGKDGEWREVWLADDAPVAAKVGVLRRDFEQTVWGVARYKSYAKGGNWNTMPDVMIAKVAESLALRKAFPQELSGVYIREEMEQAGVVDSDASAAGSDHVAGASNVSPMPPRPLPTASASAKPKAAAAPARQPADITPIKKRSWSSLRNRAFQIGVHTQEDWEILVSELTGKANAKDINGTSDYDAVEAYVADQELRRQAQAEQAVEAEGAVE